MFQRKLPGHTSPEDERNILVAHPQAVEADDLSLYFAT